MTTISEAMVAEGWCDPCVEDEERLWFFRDYESEKERARWLKDADKTVERLSVQFPNLRFHINEGSCSDTIYIDVYLPGPVRIT